MVHKIYLSKFLTGTVISSAKATKAHAQRALCKILNSIKRHLQLDAPPEDPLLARVLLIVIGMTPMKILVVEPDFQDYLDTCAVLKKLGHECLPYNAATDSIMALNSYWPDAILMNIFLDEVTALDLCLEIQKQFGEIPPVVIHSPAKEHSFLGTRFPEYAFVTSPLTTDNLQVAFKRAMPKPKPVKVEASEVFKTG